MSQFCVNCGALLQEGAKFCTICGTPIEAAIDTEKLSQEAPDNAAQQPDNHQERDPERMAQMEAAWAELEANAQPGQVSASASESASASAREDGAYHHHDENIGERKHQKAGEGKPQEKKSRKGLIIGIIIALLLLLAAGAAALYFLNNKTETIDLSPYVTVTFEGYDGYGTGTVHFDEAAFKEQNQEKVKDGGSLFGGASADTSTSDGTSNLDRLASELKTSLEKAEAIERNSWLKNGETFTLQYPDFNAETYEEEMKVLLMLPAGEYKAAGLMALTEVDPFEYVTVTFTGVNGYATASLETKKNDYQLDFALGLEGLEDDGLSNGDAMTVLANSLYSEEELARQFGVKLGETTKVYTVEGLEDAEVFDPFQYVTVTFDGYNGYGEAELDKKESEIYFSFSFVGTEYSWSAEGLSNGDTLTVEAETIYSEETLARDYGIKLGEMTKKYTVEGLKEITEVDPFDYIIVNVAGMSGEGTAWLSLADDAPDWVKHLDISKETIATNVSNGDKITVTIEVDEEEADYQGSHFGTKITKTSEECEITGMSEYATKLSELPADFLDSLKTNAENAIKQRTTSLQSVSGTFTGTEEYEYLGAVLVSLNASAEGTQTEESSETTDAADTANSIHNMLVTVFRVKVAEEGHKSGYFVTYAEFKNIVVKGDGTAELKESYVSPSANMCFVNGYVYYGYNTVQELYDGVLTNLIDTAPVCDTDLDQAALKKAEEALTIDKSAKMADVAGTYHLYSMGDLNSLSALAKEYNLTKAQAAEIFVFTFNKDGTLTFTQSNVGNDVTDTGTWSLKDGVVTYSMDKMTINGTLVSGTLTYIDGRLEGSYYAIEGIVLEKVK